MTRSIVDKKTRVVDPYYCPEVWIELSYDDGLLRELAPHGFVTRGVGLSSLFDNGIEIVARVLAHILVHSQLRISQEAEELPLLSTQIGMPHVDDKNYPATAAIVVPRFMFKRVVKDKTLSFLHVHHFVTCTKSAFAFRNHQRQMTTKLFVGWTMVLFDMGAWRQCREKRVVVVPVNGLNNSSSLRTQLPVRLEVDVVQEQVQHIPVACVVASTTQPVLRVDIASPGRRSIRLEG